MWLNWSEHHPVGPEVMDSVFRAKVWVVGSARDQSTCGRHGIRAHSGGHQLMFLSHQCLSLSSFLSRINKYILGWGFKKIKQNIPFAGPSNYPPLVSTGMVSPASILFTSVALHSQVVPWVGCHWPEHISMILFPLAPLLLQTREFNKGPN